MVDGIRLQQFDLPRVAQQAQQFRAGELSQRVNQLRLQDAESKIARQAERQRIFQGATSPTGQFNIGQAQAGLRQAGQVQEAFDLGKLQQAAQQGEINIRQGLAELQGTALDNAKKNNDIIGRASIALTQEFSNRTDAGMPREDAIRELNPFYNQVKSALNTQGVDISGLPDIFDPELTAAQIQISGAASDEIGKLEARDLARERFEAEEFRERANLAEKFTPESIKRAEETGRTSDLERLPESPGEPLTTKEQLQFEAGLRDDFIKASGNFVAIQESFGKVKAAIQEPSAAGDLAMIFSFMKMLDPTSVVREGEQASAANATGVPDRVRKLYNQLLAGEKLGTAQRKDFVRQAEKQFQLEEQRHDKRKKEFTRVAKESKLNPTRVIIDIGDPEFDLFREEGAGGIEALPEGAVELPEQVGKAGGRVFRLPNGQLVEEVE